MNNKPVGQGRYTYVIVLACVLLFAICTVWSGGVQAQRRPIATLFVAGPYVTVNGAPAANGMTIYGGDVVATGPESSANVTFFVGGSVQLNANTDPSFQDFVWQGYRCIVQIVLSYGEVYASGETACVSHGSNFASPSSEFNFRVDAAGGTLTVTEGRVMAGGAQWASFTAGTQASLAGGRIVAQRQVSGEEMRRITSWRYRYRFTQAAAPPPLPTPIARPLPPRPTNWVVPPPPRTTCPAGWVYNQARSNCVPIGATPPPGTCGPGLQYDRRSGRCVPLMIENTPAHPSPATCGPGLRYDPRTERCVPLSIENAPAHPSPTTCGPGLQYDRQKGSCEPIPPR